MTYNSKKCNMHAIEWKKFNCSRILKELFSVICRYCTETASDIFYCQWNLEYNHTEFSTFSWGWIISYLSYILEPEIIFRQLRNRDITIYY